MTVSGFLPLLTGKGKMKDRDIYWHYPHSWGPSGPGIGATCSIRSGDWKLVYYFDSGKHELFNIPGRYQMKKMMWPGKTDARQEIITEIK